MWSHRCVLSTDQSGISMLTWTNLSNNNTYIINFGRSLSTRRQQEDSSLKSKRKSMVLIGPD